MNGIPLFFSFDVYALLDLGATLYFVTPYLDTMFEILFKSLFESFNIFTQIGKSILAERVYKYCTISIYHRDTILDLLEIDMVDFNVILGMSCFMFVIP